MNLTKKSIFPAFFTTLAFFLILPSMLPNFRLFYFIPFLIIVFYQKSQTETFLFAFICGLIIDLLSPNIHLGVFALNYCLTTFILYTQKKNFFSDSLTTLPIMTFLFSIISTILQVFFRRIFDMPIYISLHWIVTDMVIMPIFDAVYAFVVFILPSILFGKKQRKGQDYFISR
jgi:rod shape-determining protein MreD